MVCERCGSIDVARSRSSRLDVFVRFLSGRKRFRCRRCGWTARRAWDENDREDRAAAAARALELVKPQRRSHER